MNADLEGILQLSSVDQEIFFLKRKKNVLPEEIERIKADILAERQEVDHLGTRISELEDENRKLEADIQEHKDGLAKSEEKLMHIKTNEEYDAVHSEIATRKVKIEECEERMLQIIAEKEALETKQKESSSQVENDEHKEKTAALKKLEQDFQAIEDNVTELEKKRALAASKIGARFLQAYERIYHGKKSGSSVGVVSDKRRSCGVCGCSLTPQRFIEVKRNNAINTCEACGSILIWCVEEEVKA